MGEGNTNGDLRILMELAKNGDPNAFSRLYELYFSPVFRYIYFRVKDRNEAEDLTQTVFVKAYQAIRRFEEQDKSPQAYFFVIARNTVIDYWRRKANKKEIILGEPGEIEEMTSDRAESPAESMEHNETAEMIRNSISHLTDEQQDVITLRFIEGLSTREVSGILGKSEEAVRQLQCRAIKSLRRRFKELKIV